MTKSSECTFNKMNVNNVMFYRTEEMSRCDSKRINHAAPTYQLWVRNSVFCNDSRWYKRCQLQEPTHINLHKNEPWKLLEFLLFLVFFIIRGSFRNSINQHLSSRLWGASRSSWLMTTSWSGLAQVDGGDTIHEGGPGQPGGCLWLGDLSFNSHPGRQVAIKHF